MQRESMSFFAPDTVQDPSSHKAAMGQGAQPRRDIGAVRTIGTARLPPRCNAAGHIFSKQMQQ